MRPVREVYHELFTEAGESLNYEGVILVFQTLKDMGYAVFVVPSRLFISAPFNEVLNGSWFEGKVDYNHYVKMGRRIAFTTADDALMFKLCFNEA